MKLRVISYNVHKCIGGVDRRYQPSRVIETIAGHAPDLALLQEVANTAGRSRWDRQVDLLGDELGFRNRVWFPNHRFRRGGEYGNAILSRWPIVETQNIDLSLPGRKKRSVLHARIRIHADDASTRTLHAFCLHLGLSGSERDIQMDRFLDSHPFARLHHETPIIVAGDFNDVWGTLGRKHLAPAGFRGAPSPRKTFPACAPLRALDAIYVRGAVDMPHVFRSRLKVATRASDHLPLIADLSLRA